MNGPRAAIDVCAHGALTGESCPMKTLDVNGVELATVDSGAGVPVVLVHGFPWITRCGTPRRRPCRACIG